MIGAIARLLEFNWDDFKGANTLQSVRYRYYRVFGKYPDGISRDNLFPFIGEAIFQTASSAFKKYASDKTKRRYKFDTMDLIRSMGVVVYYKGAILPILHPTMTAEVQSQAIARFEASRAQSEYNEDDRRRHGKRKHPSPVSTFKHAYEELQSEVSNKVITVAFIASMPYARRLELEYHKFVLIKVMQSVEAVFINELSRKIITPRNRYWKYSIGGQ